MNKKQVMEAIDRLERAVHEFAANDGDEPLANLSNERTEARRELLEAIGYTDEPLDYYEDIQE